MQINNYDIIVVGGGVAGISAALSARREHKSVLLIEKSSILGGLATSGLINWFEPLCDGKGNQLIFSQCEELFNLALKHGYKTNEQRKASWFNHNLFALSLNKLLLQEGVDVSYETLVSDIEMDGDRIESIEVATVEGKKHLKALQFLDASGNAFVFRKAGVKVREGKNYLVYATTTYKDGVSKPTFQYSGGRADGYGHPSGERLYGGLNQAEVNMFIQRSQLNCLKDYENKKLEDISSLPSIPQFRKIASIEGDYCLTSKDKLVHHEDSIGVFASYCFPDDIYEIPVGCLYSSKVKNLYACGRIISSDDEGWEASRVIPVCILTGEAAGLLAALAVEKEPTLEKLQTKLINRGNKIHS